MKNRAAPPRRSRVGRTALPLIATIALVGACDSAVGIPSDQAASPSNTVESTADESTTQESPSTTITTPAPTPIPPGPPVGEAPGNPEAAATLRPFVNDLTGGGIGVVTAKCWTVPPTDIPTMYFDTAAILAAVAAPAVDGQYAVTWTGPTATVAIKRSEIASGYACPTVYPTGTAPVFDAADAAYSVDRYLGRIAGIPVNRDDVEERYPLVCESRGTWDPNGTGSPTAPPLAQNPAILPSITSFDPDSVFVTAQNGIYTQVNADIIDASGAYQNRTFVLTVGGEGYCIGDIA
ncbi:hypothetical protein CH254_11915 [Rhodococcus sp. 06-412-2C]|uniref:hypothetical protein n=1 Tax=unclassified Rhodococcus (in: high G+C Gram-positive bacteria) TaxID=192944 RepID=UPI000B9BA6DB|nr:MULTISPECIES: hypothetical protein [unclassified Rhodococcus (in: high G+C Gram-positive bacteria)]OZC88600.1 hypothetical protein CH254_11915 [Rhodococcus sp. 06-412-2C]OZD02965.1 hypothetical protein CH279_01445 [Rhodococcus sp. 06-412-2B]